MTATGDVLLVCGLLGDRLGGAERQIVRLANALHNTGRRVVLLSKEGSRASLGLDAGVVHLSWNDRSPHPTLAARALRRFPAARRLVEHAIVVSVRHARGRASRGRSTALLDAQIVRMGRWVRGPKGDRLAAALEDVSGDIIVGFLTDPSRNLALAVWEDTTPVIVAVRSDPSRDVRAQPWEALKYVTHRRAAVVTVNASSLLPNLERFPEIGAGRGRFVPNILVQNRRPSGFGENFVCISHLAPHKRVGLAVRAFAECADRVPSWRLVIAGDGPERSALQALASKLGVGDRTDFLGEIDDVSDVLVAGGILVHPSGREGMPNAVMEALQFGLPAIVTRESPGAVELIEGTSPPAGVVIEQADPGSIAAAMVSLATDPARRRMLGASGRRSMAAFTSEAAVDVWETVLTDAAVSDSMA